MTTHKVALLAPVPEIYLVDGLVVCKAEGKIAFGSDAFDIFHRLDELRKGAEVDVYIYSSKTNEPPRLEISWSARYIGWIERTPHGHPQGMRFRPPSAVKYNEETERSIFWEVVDLRELTASERIPIRDLQGYTKRTIYGRSFVPEGPMLIQHP